MYYFVFKHDTDLLKETDESMMVNVSHACSLTGLTRANTMYVYL